MTFLVEKGMPKKALQTTEQLFLEIESIKSCSFIESKLSDLHIFQTETMGQPTHIRKNGLIFNTKICNSFKIRGRRYHFQKHCNMI